MVKTNIINKVRRTKEKFVDEKGYLSKTIQIKRLAKYANEIDMVLTKYNKKSCDETMMVKGARKSCGETTNRKIHAEDLEKTVAQIAKGLDLNEEVVKIMGKHHDKGHTFWGHGGEWWISNILEDYGIGNFCHNTLGARELIYTDKVYDEIIEKIKVHNPNVKPKELAKIRSSLWLIMDAINGHNGETPDKEFIPQSTKTEKDFEQEMLKCYVIRGYDRKLMPATPEACLMRLADKISYTPLDMVDGLREGLMRDKEGKVVDYLDHDYEVVLMKIGITKEEFDTANAKRDYTKLAERIREIFINDVIKNSTKRKIKMSKEMTVLMGELLNLNNAKAVDNVMLVEDQETYPPAVRELMVRCKNIIMENGLLPKLPNANEDMNINGELEQYRGTPDEGFINYICNTNPEDYALTVRIVDEATMQSTKDELTIARECVQNRSAYEDKEELGYDYSMKNARIRKYITYYESQLEEGKLVGYNEKSLEREASRVVGNIKIGKHNENYLPYEERIAMMISANYISSLNDMEFMKLLQDTEIINDEQYQSLTRKYKDILDLKAEVYDQKNWKEISTMQKEATERHKKEDVQL